MSLRYFPTICPYCGCGCGLYLVVKDGTVIGVEPWKEHPLGEGKLCPKGRNCYEYLYSKDRLKKPLLRKNGEFREISWEEALNIVSEKFKSVKSPEDFGAIGSGKTTNEESYLLQKFTRIVMKSNNLDYCARFCHSTTVGGLLPTVGSGVFETSITDIDKADCIIVAGVNVQETFPSIARRIYRAKDKGAKIIVIDPRTTITVKDYADIHLQLIPGTDVALLNSMMRIIIDEGLENKEFIKNRTKGYDELRKYLLTLNLEELAKITGVPLEKIREAAVTYAKASRGCILFDEGITQHSTGSDNIKALANLALLTGHIGKAGSGVNPMRGQINGEGSGDMGCLNVFYPGFKRVESEETIKFFKEAWKVEELPTKPGKIYTAMLRDCSTLYIVGTNPMVAAPDINNVRRYLEGKDFIVVQDIFLTETAQLADIVLPAASWVEKTGTYTWTDRHIQLVEKIIDPPGEAKPDWVIICEIAKKMGFKDKFSYNSSEEIFEEIRKVVPQYRGVNYRRLKETPGGIQWPCPSETHPGTPTMFTEKFGTPDGYGHFQVVQFKPPAENPDDEYPFILTTGRVLFHYHTGTMTRRISRLNSEISTGFAVLNVEDAEKLKISDNDIVRLATRRGSLKVKAKVSKDILKGVVFIPFHFSECPANILTNPASDPTGMPEFKVCAVRIEKEG